ncbi:cytochrome P450 [Streptomyces sp. 891-h]|uniref:cytochrome P450 n=1 Tax=Streptomyces sp. 891-h TaxID=2720714 RepID=UPI001FAA7E01|nr:cytochrome P450 [Streptomyces sp. 891-h]UNZ21239.1 cytochrome P450 [Streptomyces sp. 891-h]
MLRDPRFSTDPAREGFPTGSTAPRPAPDPAKRRARAFITMDEPEHGRYRRMLIPAFSARRTEAMRPRVEAIVDELIDRMTAQGREADFVEVFARPLPSRVICELLGVDHAGADVFQEKSATAMDPEREPEERVSAASEFAAYLGDVVAEKRAHPGDDLLSRLIEEQVATGRLDDEQLNATAMALLIAGYETTTHMLSLSLVTLTQQPELLERLAKNTQFAAPAVDELLRIWTVGHLGLYRAAVEDVEVHGRTIRAGQGVIVAVAAADRDPDVFEDPDTFDPDREPRANLAFGYGAHRCLGEPLARLELEIALRRIAERLPALRLRAEVAELSFRDEHYIYGLDELPIAW